MFIRISEIGVIAADVMQQLNALQTMLQILQQILTTVKFPCMTWQIYAWSNV